jgi:hypothetical protein
MKLIFIFTILVTNIIFFTGCKKYEDGPVFSIYSKKSRVVNLWKVDKYIDNTGIDHTSDFDNFTVEFKKNDNYNYTNNGVVVQTGSWQFSNNKEDLMLSYSDSSSSNNLVIWHILKLEKKELWIKVENSSDERVIHFSKK